ncbi:hypothetical protein DMJ13_17345 [halophilic archaeon]|nr:hypothetical protein DMJ13_17345 [halophilic archaeon]
MAMSNTTTSGASTPIDESDASVSTLVDHVQQLTDRIADLEQALADKNDRIDTLKSRVSDLEQEHTTDCDHCTDLETRVEKLEAREARLDHIDDQIAELQARELTKGAHLHEEHVYPSLIDDNTISELEKITKDDGREYYRVLGRDDPTESDGAGVALAHADLLPIQQLTRIPRETRDNHMSATDRRATWTWEQRTDDRRRLWNDGGSSVQAYLDCGDLATELRVEFDIARDSAAELAGRVLEALVDLTNNRCYIQKTTKRHDGCTYKERRLVLPADAEIPGETQSMEVTG